MCTGCDKLEYLLLKIAPSACLAADLDEIHHQEAVMAHQLQSSQLPAAQPTYVLRGHSAQIHSVLFLRSNTRILTGDADGWVVLWNIATKRAVAVWKAHKTTILGLGSWRDEGIIT